MTFARRVMTTAALALAVASLGSPAVARGSASVWRPGRQPFLSGTRTIKVDLIDKLSAAPQVVILGSSRAMKVDPAYLHAQSGLRGFNAAVSSGRPPDAWCLVNYIHARFPAAQPRCFWLLDIEGLRPEHLSLDLLREPRLAAYLPLAMRLGHGDHGAIWRQVNGGPKAEVSVFDADGFLRMGKTDLHPGRMTLQEGIARILEEYSLLYPHGYTHLDAQPEWFVEHVLALFNSWGVTPVIVVSPVHPAYRARFGPLGWNARRTEVLAYLRGLQSTYDLEVVDCSMIEKYGGKPTEFYDAVHPRVELTRRIVRYVLAHSGTALTP